MQTLSIIIPCYNEIHTIAACLDRVFSVSISLHKEIIIVDDGSSDGTREYLADLSNHPAQPIKVIFHDKNQGKGAAIATGLQQASGDFVLIQDADLEYFPSDYPALLAPLVNAEADVVYGSRFLLPGAFAKFQWTHYLANRFLTLLTNVVGGLRLTDMETCYKVISKHFYPHLAITEQRFGLEPEITLKLARMKARFVEVPIQYNGRSVEEGKKIGLRDGLWAIACIIRFGLR